MMAKIVVVFLTCLFLSLGVTGIVVDKLNGKKQIQLYYADYEYYHPTSIAIFSILLLTVLIAEITLRNVSLNLMKHTRNV